jgi:hypothetical protein
MKFFLGFACLLLPLISVVAQPPARGAFAEVERQVQSQQGGWNGDKDKLSTVFARVRRQLGDNFEAELLVYITGDAEKHYWISAFLEEPSYLKGNKALPHLSLLIMEQGVSLLRDKTDQESVGLTLSFNVIATVLSKKLGLVNLAMAHKQDAEHRLSTNSDWGAFWPAMSEDDRKIYDDVQTGLKTVHTSLPSDDDPARPQTRVSAGVLNGKALNLPVPKYPPSARDASGQVIVSIVFDETGKVIWAHATSGPPLLQKAAEESALKATFPPFRLEGKPEKVSGVLIYNFVR